jgi:group I intron endonuclease
MQGIYLILNKINLHGYEGQSVDIDRRWNEHRLTPFNPKHEEYEYPLYRAIRKYGLENFAFIVLEELPNATAEELLEREIFWYETLDHTYNQIHPSQRTDNKQAKAVYQIDINTLKIIKTYDSLREVIRKNNYKSRMHLTRVCNRINISANGYYWCYAKDYHSNWKPPVPLNLEIYTKKRSKIIAINSNTKKIKYTFNTTTEAADFLGCTAGTIQYNIKNNKVLSGYLWSYV